ncbi:DUF982 domain-containing protein [Neorhizobium alkalisoli]|uniref:Uncharacterized protein DUF982 n=1 Tax=Neorhizobium alkalisoli TaxID=528178 RepID=A0A561QBD0_9HYPH|nr:DUF982 domain-containing protein [Neorhizobium alkalisoli]TWF47647.1 uncharacterized protein DUF982 [Neorhizobium alkalisoli]
MAETKWMQPVAIKSPFLGEVAVTGPFHALTILMDYWPAMAGAHYMKARIACSAALQGRVDPEHARIAFQLAAKEADEATRAMQGAFSGRSGAGSALS